METVKNDEIKVIVNGTEKTIRVYGGEYFEQDILESGNGESNQDSLPNRN